MKPVEIENDMYALTISIYTDDDFSYTDNEFDTDYDVEKTFYFKDRTSAVESFERYIDSVSNTIRGEKYIVKWFTLWRNRIKLFLHKIDNVRINGYFGNQDVKFELKRVTKKEMPNGSFTYVDNCENVTDICGEEDYDWDAIKEMKDI